MRLIKVTNRNNTTRIVDMYGGQKYVFEPGETIAIPEEAAEHIFGWGMDEAGRRKKMMRMGLANEKNGQKVWDNVVMRASSVEATGVEREAEGLVDRVIKKFRPSENEA